MPLIVEQFSVESDSSPGRFYTVSQMDDASWQCSCVGWTRHVPRRDCKHIAVAREGHAATIDPLLALVAKARHKESRKLALAAKRSLQLAAERTAKEETYA